VGDSSLAVEIRQDTGKGVARKLRAAGRMPAVLYGHGRDSVSLSLNTHDLESLLKKSDAGINTLMDLQGEGKLQGAIVLIKELQRHPVRATLVHADLFEVKADEKLTVTVPIHLLGTAAGVKLGGIMEQTMREIELACLPNAIPDSIEIEVNAMELGDALHVSDLTIPVGCEKTVEDSTTVAHVVAPKLPTEEEEAAEAAAAEAAAEGEEPKVAAEGDDKAGSDSES